jgi:hypothetical protein
MFKSERILTLAAVPDNVLELLQVVRSGAAPPAIAHPPIGASRVLGRRWTSIGYQFTNRRPKVHLMQTLQRIGNVRIGSKADLCTAIGHVRFTR